MDTMVYARANKNGECKEIRKVNINIFEIHDTAKQNKAQHKITIYKKGDMNIPKLKEHKTQDK